MPKTFARKSGEPPEEISEYRILRLIGRGRMGRVYLAQDTYLERLVALKFIASVRPDARARERFLLEGRALARLVHPNVVAVHRVDQINGHPYLVAEYVRGQTLAEMEKPVNGERARRIAIGIVRGLAAAHRQGILHRDIKPANVMVDTDGEVKLLDFGLAKMLEEPSGSSVEDGSSDATEDDAPGKDKPQMTGAGGFVGTPLYMAPEVLQGAAASRRSDIFAVGAVLYELLTGKPPRPIPDENSSFEQWATISPAPLTSQGGMDQGLAAAIDRCLRTDAALRFASADELRDALENLDTEENVGEIPEGNPYRGLEPFDEAHRTLFFGRGVDIRAVIDRLRSEPLVVVTGDSGVGKSSMCRAGVLPKIRDGALGDGRRYRTLTMVPGAKPIAALMHAIAPIFDENDNETLRTDPIAALQRAARSLPRDEGLLLFVDQLEELHTLSDPNEAVVFGELLATLGSSTSGVRVLATVRGDFFTRLASIPVLGESLPSALHLLRPLSPEAMREAVVGPARRTGARFESERLVDELVDTACRTVGGLPLLQFALAALWDAQDRASRCIPESALQSIGGVAGALAQHADSIVGAMAPPEAREAAQRLLVRLVSADGTIIRRPAEEMTQSEASKIALEALVRGRLVVARVLDGRTSYELAHEALTRQWDTLRDWLHEDREARIARQRIEMAAAEWERLGRTREALFQERQLAELNHLEKIELSTKEVEFLDASKQMARRRRWERLARYAALPLIAAIILLGARQKARHDLSRVIEQHESEGRVAQTEGEREQRLALQKREQAFARFDAAATLRDDEARACRDDAEKQWAQALESGRNAEVLLAKASRSWEAGLALDPSQKNLRRLIADAYVERIKIADAFFEGERKQELIDHLPFYDDDGSRQQRLTARPHVSIESLPSGADVDLERYDVRDGRVQSTLIGRLGKTPLSNAEITSGPGSYRLVVHAAERAAVHYPVVLAPGEHLQVSVDVPAKNAIPEGYVYIPAGRHYYGTDAPEGFRYLLTNQPLHQVHTPAFVIEKTEVTYASWTKFLDDLPAEERSKHLPSTLNRQWAVELSQNAEGQWSLSLWLNEVKITARAGEPFVIPGRTRRREQDWLKFPVTAINKFDADAYAAWLERTGRVKGARLCNEREWERAARGADARIYAHGYRLEPDDAAFDETYGRQTAAFGPDMVDEHPISTSPFGILGMTGSIHEYTMSVDNQNEVIFRGGAWYFDRTTVRVDNRFFGEPKTRDHLVGLRMCASYPQR